MAALDIKLSYFSQRGRRMTSLLDCRANKTRATRLTPPEKANGTFRSEERVKGERNSAGISNVLILSGVNIF